MIDITGASSFLCSKGWKGINKEEIPCERKGEALTHYKLEKDSDFAKIINLY